MGSAAKILKELDLDDKCIQDLLLAGLVHQFDSKVLLIMDWKIHNQISPSKYQETIHQSEYKYLNDTKSKRYVIMSDEELRVKKIEEPNIEVSTSGKEANKSEKAKEFEARLAEQKTYKSVISSM